ncbi:MAG TPA: AI-2E family transporter [Ktedonobacterales bacterium]|nr:AI-2E family transporter [Ktedonobacterales bacterium]
MADDPQLPPTITHPSEAPRDAAQTWARRRDIAIAVLVWLIIASAAVWGAAHFVRVLLILVVAALLAYALMPAVAYLTRWVPRWVAILVVYLAFVSAIGALGYLTVTAVVDQIGALSRHLTALIAPAHQGTSPLVQKLEQLGIPAAQIDAAGAQLLAQTQVVAAGLVPLLEGVFNGVLDAVLVTVLSIYLLVDGERLIRWLRTSAPIKHRPRVTFVFITLQSVVGGYIRGQLILCTLIGVLVGVGMELLGVPYAVLLGVMAFLLEFIPIIGVLISGAACVLLALTQGWLTALLVLAYFVFVHIIEGDVVGPRVVGKAVGVHPAVSLVALVAGGELFGIWGALFASPIAGLIQTVATELWRDWRLTHASQFPEQFGPPVVPVTTAEAAVERAVTTTATETATEAVTPASAPSPPSSPTGAPSVPLVSAPTDVPPPPAQRELEPHERTPASTA